MPAGVWVPAVQVLAPQVVPAAYLWQPPLPSQVPSVPQALTSLSAHWPRGSCPAGTLVQVPAEPGSAHDLHVPLQSDTQQTPCAQMFEAQSLSAVQIPPGGSLPQLFIVHLFPVVQSTSAEQFVRHCPLPPHWNAPQDCASGVTHLPAPSQDPAAVNVEPVQPPS